MRLSYFYQLEAKIHQKKTPIQLFELHKRTNKIYGKYCNPCASNF